MKKSLIEIIYRLIPCLIIGMVLFMIIIGLTSATYAGETFTHTFDGEIINCSIINNTYDLNGLNLTWNNSIATITTLINYKPDNFTLSCWINKTIITNEVIHHSSGGGYVKQKNNINITNQSQQENSSISSGELNNFSSPADNLPPILNIPSDELNKQTKSFFKSLLDFFKSYWIAILIGFLMIFLVWVIYYIFKETEKEILFPDEINEEKK